MTRNGATIITTVLNGGGVFFKIVSLDSQKHTVKSKGKSLEEIKMYRNMELTDEEKVLLDDGQGWYKVGDNVCLSGYLPEKNELAVFDLIVNGYVHDNWVFLHDIPQSIQKRLLEG